MAKLVTMLILGFAVAPILSDPRPDLTVPATITGVSTGSLDTTGNMVANIDRILSILNQFHSINENLYYIESTEMSDAAEKFRNVMDSLVETGSPIFQALSNVARVSTGDIVKAFDGIREDINTSASLNSAHLLLVNQTQAILGPNTTLYFDGVLNQLAANLGNISRLLDNIQTAVAKINSLNPKTQAAIKALLPNDEIKALNAVLRQYIAIGDSAIPQIRSVVNSVRTVDSFIMRLRRGFDQLRQSMNTSLASLPATMRNKWDSNIQNGLIRMRNQIVSQSSRSTAALSNLLFSDVKALANAANGTLPMVQNFARYISSNVQDLINQTSLPNEIDVNPGLVMDFTEMTLANSARQIVEAVTQRAPNADTCYSRYNVEFDRIPQNTYRQLYQCSIDKSNQLSDTSSNLNYLSQLMQADASSALLAIERCTSLVTTYATELTKHQAAACLETASLLLDIHLNYVDQAATFSQVVTKERSYNYQRYDICLGSAALQTVAQVNYLESAINRCLNPTTVVTPRKWKVRGQVTIGFGR